MSYVGGFMSNSLSEALSKIPSKLPTPIEQWRQWHKLWSVRLSAFGSILMTALTVWPDRVFQIWLMMPPEVRRLMPEQMITSIAAIIFLLTAVSRVIKQKKLAQ